MRLLRAFLIAASAGLLFAGCPLNDTYLDPVPTAADQGDDWNEQAQGPVPYLDVDVGPRPGRRVGVEVDPRPLPPDLDDWIDEWPEVEWRAELFGELGL